MKKHLGLSWGSTGGPNTTRGRAGRTRSRESRASIHSGLATFSERIFPFFCCVHVSFLRYSSSCYLRQAWSVTSGLDLLALESQGSVSCFPSAGLTSLCHYTQPLFKWGVVESELRSLRFQGKHFTSWATTGAGARVYVCIRDRCQMSSSTALHLFWEGLSFNLEFTGSAGLLGQWVPEVPTFLRTGSTDMCCHAVAVF